MSDEFQKWISNKNLEISDKIDENSNKNNSDSYLIKNDFLKSQSIKVFLSKQSTVDLIVTNSSITNANNNNVFKWFNDNKLRKELIQTLFGLLSQSTKVLEFLETISSKTSIKISRNRVQNLLKTLDFSIKNLIFNYSNEYQFKSVEYSVIKLFESNSVLLKVINEVIQCLISGIPVVLVAEGDSVLFAAYLLDLCERAGIHSGVINLVIVNSKTAIKLSQTTEPMDSPIFVVLESADIDSAVDRTLSSLVNDSFGSLNVFVQQSVYQKFCDRIKTRSTNSLEIGEKFDEKTDILSKININYEAIDFDNRNKSIDIQVFKFRTNAELKTLVNHFTAIPYICLWAEKTSLALELAKNIDSSSVLFINGSPNYPLKVNKSVFDKVINKTELNQKNPTFGSIINSYKKWKTIGSEERLRIIREFLIKTDTKVTISPSALEAFNEKIISNNDNYGTQVVITDFEPIGLLVLEINTEINQRIMTLILEALISGNVLLISCAKPLHDLNSLNQYLSSLGQNCLNFVDMSDQQIKGNSILTFAGNSVGIYLQEFDKISRNSLIKLKKCMTLSMGDISFAK